MIPAVYKRFHPDKDPIVLVVSPINALIDNQIKWCAEIGIIALHVSPFIMRNYKFKGVIKIFYIF